VIDIKFAINGLEAAKRLISIGPGTGSRKCRAMDACDNAISLLREQEPVPAKIDGVSAEVKYGACPNCGEGLNSEVYPNWCGFCGQAVTWNG
jgi:hypothetical protein